MEAKVGIDWEKLWLFTIGTQIRMEGMDYEGWFGQDIKLEVDLRKCIFLLVSIASTSFSTFSISIARSSLSFFSLSNSKSIFDMTGLLGANLGALICIPTTFCFPLHIS